MLRVSSSTLRIAARQAVRTALPPATFVGHQLKSLFHRTHGHAYQRETCQIAKSNSDEIDVETTTESNQNWLDDGLPSTSGQQEPLEPGLYIVATPIGRLRSQPLQL